MDCAIDDYLAQLTHSELYRVKSKILAHIRLASRGPEALPVEIIVMISEYLSVRDLSRQRRVSKAWSVIWDQPAISSALCRRVWPGYMECHAGQGPSQDPGALLLKGVKETMGALPKAEQGKLAWSMMKEETRVKVHDLASGDVQHFRFSSPVEGGPPPIVQAVSAQLLVLSGGLRARDPTSRLLAEPSHSIIICHLETGTQRTVLLPDAHDNSEANNGTVFIATHAQAFVWQWTNHRLVQLEFEDLLDSALATHEDVFGGCGRASSPQVLYHPRREDVLFICLEIVAPYGERCKCQEGLAIIKYSIKATQVIRRLRLIDVGAKLSPDLDWPCEWFELQESQRVAINRYGTYALVQGRSKEAAEVSCLLCFNVITEVIQLRLFEYPREAQFHHDPLQGSRDAALHLNILGFSDSRMTSAVVLGTDNGFDVPQRILIFKHTNVGPFPRDILYDGPRHGRAMVQRERAASLDCAP